MKPTAGSLELRKRDVGLIGGTIFLLATLLFARTSGHLDDVAPTAQASAATGTPVPP